MKRATQPLPTTQIPLSWRAWPWLLAMAAWLLAVGCPAQVTQKAPPPERGARDSAVQELSQDANKEKAPEAGSDVHETPAPEQPPELPPEPTAPEPTAAGRFDTKACGTTLKALALDGVDGVAPQGTVTLDEHPDGAATCSISFSVDKPHFATLSLQWHKQPDVKPVASMIWLQLNKGMWSDWYPALGQTGWQTNQVSIGSKRAPWTLWLTAGKHTLSISWSRHDIALAAWSIKPKQEWPQPPKPQKDPLTWPYPTPTKRYDVKAYGAKGDGKSDDSAAIQAAIQAVGDSKKPGVVWLPKGTYRLEKIVTIKASGVILRGEGIRSRIAVALEEGKHNWKAGIIASGKACQTQWPLQESAKRGDTTLTLGPKHDIKPGDTLHISASDSQEKSPTNSSKALLRYQQDLLEVKGVKGSTVTLHRPLRLDFPKARAAKACRYQPLRDVGFEDFAIYSTNAADINGINVIRGLRVWARGLHISQIPRFGLHWHLTREGRITHNTYRSARRFDGGGHGYGFNINTSHDSTLAFNQIRKVRHGIAVQFGAGGNTVIGNQIADSTLAGIDIHGEYNHHNRVAGNWITQATEGIIVGGGHTSHANDGPNNSIDSNVIGPDVFIGLHVANGTQHTTLQDNHLFGTMSVGVFVFQKSHNTLVQRNLIDGLIQLGVHLEGDDIQILKNNIKLRAKSRASVLVSSFSNRYIIKDNRLSGIQKIIHPNKPDAKVENNGP